MSARPRLFLLDSFGLIFRAFYGRGTAHVAAMRTQDGRPTEAVYIFLNMVRKLIADFKPDYLAAAWESLGPTFRDEMYPEYKANRDEAPDDLKTQIPMIRRLLETMDIPVLQAPGFEADDVMGTIAQRARADADVYLVTSDKDMTQLVGDGVFVLNPMKDNLVYDPPKVEEIMGVRPEHIIDLLALMGDTVDNIPGAPGIGPKGAKDLIGEYGGIEGAIEKAGEVKRKTYRESLQNHPEQIRLSKKLATIACDAPVDYDLTQLQSGETTTEAFFEYLRELEFHSLVTRLQEGGEAPQKALAIEELTSGQVAPWLENADGPVTLEMTFPEGEPIVGLCAADDSAARVTGEPTAELRDFLANPSQPKRVHDAKRAANAAERFGTTLQGVTDDVLLTAFLTDPVRADYSLEKIAPRHLGEKPDGDPARTASITHRLGQSFAALVQENGLAGVYEQIELPLWPVLRQMERLGIFVDTAVLAELSADLGQRIDALTEQIYALAGSPFNINSPKQLGQILYEDLKLPAPGRRGKTKTPSTAQDVLEKLAPKHEIVGKVLDYRQLSKLKNTYVDALPALVNPETDRVHTTFHQTGAATGRLSSNNPNLQNIPIRTEQGREIRAAFRARENWTLLSADYSQIELRVLAHLSEDTVLCDSFRKGEDIHTRTAAEVFDIMPALVGSEERRRAKAVNFGIVYGQSAFGLAQTLQIPRSDAQRYIDAYFQRYSGVSAYLERAVEDARTSGFATTMYGRTRPIPDLDSKSPTARGFAERTAVNSPIQGAAADLIKLAMIHIHKSLAASGLEAAMLLTVHDELLFEAPESEIPALAELVKRDMEGVAELAVPLVADVKIGPNWRDMQPLQI